MIILTGGLKMKFYIATNADSWGLNCSDEEAFNAAQALAAKIDRSFPEVQVVLQAGIMGENDLYEDDADFELMEDVKHFASTNWLG
jgi:short-subunit dehydrogenase involved in D-alanine esterification of teichoic acids